MGQGTANSGAGLLMVVLILLAVGLTASVLTVRVRLALDEQSTVESQRTLRMLAESISSTNFTQSNLLNRHYEQDVGSLPSALADLQTKPGSAASCSLSTTTRALTGWCGPYWDPPAFNSQNAFADGWGNSIVLNTSSRHVRSNGPNLTDDSGGSDDLVQKF